MPSLDVTNLILGLIAAAAVGQLALIVYVSLSLSRQVAQLQRAVVRFESTHLPDFTVKVNGLMDDFHRVANRIDYVGREVEHTAQQAQSVLSLAGSGVERATRGVHAAFDVVENGVRRVSRARTTVLQAGVNALLSLVRGRARRERLMDADAVARFEAKA